MTENEDRARIAAHIVKLVEEKQAAYGDSFGKSGKVLALLYADGVSVDQYDNFLAITRVIDKLFRIAADADAFGESPWLDILGYSLLAAAKVNAGKNKEEEEFCAARETGAEDKIAVVPRTLVISGLEEFEKNIGPALTAALEQQANRDCGELEGEVEDDYQEDFPEEGWDDEQEDDEDKIDQFVQTLGTFQTLLHREEARVGLPRSKDVPHWAKAAKATGWQSRWDD